MNEIITSGAKNHTNGSSDVPWMTDGGGLPSDASELLPKLVIAFLSETLNAELVIISFFETIHCAYDKLKQSLSVETIFCLHTHTPSK